MTERMKLALERVNERMVEIMMEHEHLSVEECRMFAWYEEVFINGHPDSIENPIGILNSGTKS